MNISSEILKKLKKNFFFQNFFRVLISTENCFSTIKTLKNAIFGKNLKIP